MNRLCTAGMSSTGAGWAPETRASETALLRRAAVLRRGGSRPSSRLSLGAAAALVLPALVALACACRSAPDAVVHEAATDSGRFSVAVQQRNLGTHAARYGCTSRVGAHAGRVAAAHDRAAARPRLSAACEEPAGSGVGRRVRWEVANALHCDYAKQSVAADLERAGLPTEQLSQLDRTDSLPEPDRSGRRLRAQAHAARRRDRRQRVGAFDRCLRS